MQSQLQQEPEPQQTVFPNFDFSINPCTKFFSHELKSVYPHLSQEETMKLHVVITFQPLIWMDLAQPVNEGDKIQEVKDENQSRFFSLMEIIEAKLKEKVKGDKLFFDFVDPATGLMRRNENSNNTYYENIGIQHFHKNFKTQLVGLCRVFLHPVYGLNCYPASFFTNYESLKGEEDESLSEILKQSWQELELN